MTNDQSQSNDPKQHNQITSDASGGELPQKQIVKTKTTKQPSASFKKIQDHRDRLNAGRECLQADDLTSAVYLYENRVGKACAIGYRGRAKKAAFNYCYKDAEARMTKVLDWMNNQSEKENAKQEAKQQRAAIPRALQAGDILMASWGWEQTNIDYFKVISLVGTNSVEVIEVGAIRSNESDMTGRCIPSPYSEIGKAFTRRVIDGHTIKVDNVRRASKLEYKVVEGKRVYKPSYYSTYG